jgi:chromosome segregation ATPase
MRKIMITSEIQNKIDELTHRRERLAGETEQARIAVTEARAALLESDSKRTMETATTAQARLTMLDATLAALDEQIAELGAQLRQAEAYEAREARVDSLMLHAREADGARHDYEAAQVELNEHMTILIARMVDAKKRWRASQMSWISEAKPLAEGVTDFAFMRSDARDHRALEAEADALLVELETRGANLDAVLARDVTAQRWLANPRPYPVATPAPFGGDIERLVLTHVDGQLIGVRHEQELRREHPERFTATKGLLPVKLEAAVI